MTCRKCAAIAGVLPTAAEDREAARLLARQLGTELLKHPPAEGLYLALSCTALRLCLRSARRMLAVHAQFSAGQRGDRADRASPRGEAIARACGLPRYGARRIVDATAGLGRDAHILARLGAQVTLLERSPVIFALLADAFERSGHLAATQPWRSRMRLIGGDAAQWLQSRSGNERPEVVYLDPMYPPRAKRASPGKEMQVLHALLGTSNDADTLLQVAGRSATDRVVVKRPRRAEPLAGLSPHYRITGRSTRFDVYLCASLGIVHAGGSDRGSSPQPICSGEGQQRNDHGRESPCE